MYNFEVTSLHDIRITRLEFDNSRSSGFGDYHRRRTDTQPDRRKREVIIDFCWKILTGTPLTVPIPTSRAFVNSSTGIQGKRGGCALL